MTKRILLLSFALLSFCMVTNAQTIEELKAAKAEKEAQLAPLAAQLAELTGQVDALKADVADLTDKVTPYPRWDVGALGNLGLSISGFNNWFPKSTPNTTAVNIGFSANSFANLQQRNYFWRNNANLALAWLKFDNEDVGDDNPDFQVAADAFNVSSLFGYKLSEKWAISTLGEYRTSILDGKFNNPGYLDIGAGATWTPITDMVVVFHPLNYNFVFSDSDFNYESSLGCKVVADYKQQITPGLAWKSNFSGFFSYEGSNLHNWTFINGITTAVKGIGIGFDIGLRKNKQEALAADANRSDNPLQMYYLIGLSYAIGGK
ncbi:MAG: DUF3078 domain-containing protein [Saprospiraceae bacterium]|nr:DUF3078 domain-containing protein [Saprospiraceae bacterium]MCF8250266.1 DUF3078 domain-containing protein [Saprospiraceae bacterium]MCF8280906.1 DUF3078 domain-containing protein [Bacteroidales bacterium]MCF8312102.1 DUF3078 domain-containing protein [Saprospiraceae bacterium]MCF8440509.1 DUF3078 domain-containing protein [Saprospiraceae bacterium]